MKRFRFIILIFFTLSIGLFVASANPVSADTSTRGCETNTMKSGVYCNWGELKSWCAGNTLTCAVESTTACPANPSNGSYAFSCNSNSCVLSCDGGYTNCSGTCTAIGSSPNCSSYNSCTSCCTACNAGYTVSSCACVAATLRLGSDSVVGTSVAQSNTATALYITGGNTGVGTSTPAAKLQISPGAGVEGLRVVSSDYSPFVVRNAANTADFFRIDENGTITGLNFSTGGSWSGSGTNVFLATSTNKVGIGLTNPQTKLQAHDPAVNSTVLTLSSGSSYTADYGPMMVFRHNVASELLAGIKGSFQSSSQGNYGVLSFYTRTSDALGIEEKMRIISDGNVGIGTTAPAAKLHVTAGAGNNTAFRIGNNSTNDAYFYFNTNADWSIGTDYSNSNAFTLSSYSSLGTNNRLTVQTGGNVGIGSTNPSFVLDVTGSARFTNTVQVATPTSGAHAATKDYVDASVSNTVPRSTQNMDPDPEHVGLSGFAFSGGWSVAGPANTLPVGRYYYTSSGTSGLGLPKIPIDRTKNYRASLWAKTTSGTGTTYMTIYLWDQDGNSISGDGTFWWYVVSGQTLPTTWTKYTFVAGPQGARNFPANAAYMSYGISHINYNAAGDTYHVAGMSIEEETGWVAHSNKITYSDGNVGIGTAAPSGKLHVASGNIKLDTGGYALEFGSGNDTIYGSTGYLRMETGGVDRLHIDSSGNVGINDTTPTYKLDVDGTGQFTGTVVVATPTADSHAATKAYVDSAAGGGVGAGATNQTLRHNGTGWVANSSLSSNGTNVGIGTTAPGYKLEVNGNAWIKDSLWIGDDSTGANASEARIFRASDREDGTMTIQLGGNDAVGTKWEIVDRAWTKVIASISGEADGASFVVDSSGNVSLDSGTLFVKNSGNNVGIGTTNPQTNLNVIGKILTGSLASGNSYNGGISVYNNANEETSLFLWQSGIASGKIGFPANNNNLRIVNTYTDGSISNAAAIDINTVGNVGINDTTPSYKLDVNGTGQFTGTVVVATPTADGHAATKAYVDSASGGGVGAGTTGQTLRHNGTGWIANSTFFNNGTNVGVGTTAPVYKLEVNGDIRGNLAERINSVSTRITNPKEGYYFTTASTVTGALAITLPSKMADAMISFWVDIYDYALDETFSVFVSGYPYSTAGVWSATSALVLGSHSNRNFTVRFGGSTDNTRSIVYIGETSSTWSYPQVTVRDVMAGYSSNASEIDDLPWDVTFETTLLNIDVTETNNFPYADWNRLINRPSGTTNYVTKWTGTNSQGNSIIFDNGTNVGIGTTAPTAKLEANTTYETGKWAFVVNQSTVANLAPATHDQVLIQRQDVAALKIVDIGDSNALGLSAGDGNATISSVNTLRFYVNGSMSGNAYSGMSGSQAMFIKADGNVGINDSTPSYKLDVTGTGQFTNTVVVATPTAGTHAATKDYVDSAAADADTLDGSHLDDIVYGSYKGTFHSVTMDANDVDRTGFYSSAGFTNRPAGSAWTYLQNIRLYSSNNSYHKQISYDTYNNNMWTRTNSGGIWSAWYKMWNEANDGASSGLDADLFDSRDSDDFIDDDGDTINGPLVMNASYLNVNRSGSGATGIQWYSSGYNAWAEYMAPVGAGAGPRGTLTAQSGNIVTSWALRSFIENAGGYGWTFESGTSSETAPNVVAEIRASDGSAWFDGQVRVATPTSGQYAATKDYVDSAAGGGVGAGTTGQTLRHNGTSWVADSILVNTGTYVGIGKTNPGIKLDVDGGSAVAARFTSTADAQMSLVSSDSWTGIAFDDSGAVNDYIWYNGSAGTFAIGGGGGSASGKKLHVDGGMTIGSSYDSTAMPTNGLRVEGQVWTTGNAGVGTTNPAMKLHVGTGGEGDGNIMLAAYNSSSIGQGIVFREGFDAIANRYNLSILTDNTLADGSPDGLSINAYEGIAFRTGSNASSTPKVYINQAGNLGIGTTAPGSYKLNVNGNTNITGTLNVTGTTTVGAFSVGSLSVNKLTANTIDPLYKLNGVNYSTFASSIVGGVKEEYIGRIKVDTEATIDFDKVKEGSDLWVWREVVDFNEDNVDVLVTPYGKFAQVYYVVEDNKIIFHSNEPVEISYRLVGKRLDWKQWPTKAIDQSISGWEIK